MWRRKFLPCWLPWSVGRELQGRHRFLGLMWRGKREQHKKLSMGGILINIMSPLLWDISPKKSQILITVVVDEPKMKAGRLGYGGSVAGPAFKRVGTKIVGYLGLKPKPQQSRWSIQKIQKSDLFKFCYERTKNKAGNHRQYSSQNFNYSGFKQSC